MSPASITVGGVWHPWRALRRLTHVDVHWTADLPSGVRGVTDGERIWMDSRQLQAERRCTLAHELEHINRGHAGCVDVREEEDVRRAAARRLISIEGLLHVAAWTENFEEAADELWVDLDTLYARLDAVTDEERRLLLEQHEAVERGM